MAKEKRKLSGSERPNIFSGYKFEEPPLPSPMDKIETVREAGRFFDEGMLKVLTKVIKPGMRYADMGGGTGDRVICAAKLGASVDSIEIDPEIYDALRSRMDSQHGKARWRVRVIQSNLFENPLLKGEKYDVISMGIPPLNERVPSIGEEDVGIFQDPGFKILDNFLRQSLGHLNPGGVVLVGYGYDDETAKDGRVERGGRQTLERIGGIDYDIKCALGKPALFFGIFELRPKKQRSTST